MNPILWQTKNRGNLILQRSSLALAEKKGLEKGLEQGLEQGMEKGREQGIAMEREEIARKLLDVLDDATIARKTGLNIAQLTSSPP